MYKAPALLSAVFNICGALLMYFVFDEKYAGLKEDNQLSLASIPLPPANLIAVVICIITRFTQLSVSTNIETLSSAYSMLMFDLSAPEAVSINSVAQAVQGIIAVLILLPFLFSDIDPLARTSAFDTDARKIKVTDLRADAMRIDSRGLRLCPRWTFGCTMLHWCVVFEMAFAIGDVVLSTLFSKVIAPRRQGTMQGIFQMSGAVARISEPVILKRLPTNFSARNEV
ncbi:hypothetical protein ANCDUO_03479 [Ancylostoma duodenale]|uniref:Uncharacterized protein n=1 Tax=Ancylostoma duodenale TaxID=51022 RepID=A0A0C2GXD5_9BILA|nr:hypothetical protein ANCDUO_03479 [Ancylostoma duodenale]